MLLLFLLAGLVGGPGNSVDRAVIHSMDEFRASAPDTIRIALTVTALGGAAFTLPLAGLAAISLLLRRRTVQALILTAIVLGERVAVDLLKDVISRPRPPAGELIVGSMAYPSGHAANSIAAFFAVALLAVPVPYRRPAVIAAVVLSLLVGLTRVFLGVHWPSDVIGGWAFGLAAVAAALIVARRLGVPALEAKHEIVGRHRDATGQDKTP